MLLARANPFYLLLLFLCGSVLNISAQIKLPVIKATSKTVSIRDEGFLDKDGWTLTPEARPDEYTAYRTRKIKYVVFYTDIDSFKVKLLPGQKIDFVILLNGKDSCFTRISSAISNEALPKAISRDTIPFVLNNRGIIGVKAIFNSKDTVKLHFDIGSSEFRLTQNTLQTKSYLKPFQKIQLGQLVFDQPKVLRTGLTARGMEGRFGWNLFEGKCVEIDYNKGVMVIHSHTPKIPKGYIKLPLQFIHSFVCLTGETVFNGKKQKSNFLLDSGSDKALILDSAWAAKQSLPGSLNILHTSKLSDPRGKVYETRTVSCPKLEIGKFRLENVPATILAAQNPVGFEINYFGMSVLKQYNSIFDFRNDVVYLKENNLTGSEYQKDL
jgi:hypothetical protein